MNSKKPLQFFTSFTIFVVVSIFANYSLAQIPVVYRANYSGPLEYSFQKLRNFPPLSPDMPLDVRIGYVYLDSFAQTVPMSTIINELGDYRSYNRPGSIGYSDTFRYLAKYLYEMDDYDPIRFSQYTNLLARGVRYLSGGVPFLTEDIEGMIAKKSPDTLRTTLLCGSDYIADVRITAIDSMTDPDVNMYSRTAFKVTCNILDLIKGQVVPSCIPDTFPILLHCKSQPLSGSFPRCIQFEYRLEWPRINHGDAISNEDSTFVINGHPWIQLDSEYIVYLYLHNLGYDTVNSYATISPCITAQSKMGSMFPVVGGLVSDWYDEMGFGQGLSVAEYKKRLRAKIQTITNP